MSSADLFGSLHSLMWTFSPRAFVPSVVICQVTERLLNAVVPFIALHPRIESMLRHEVHIGGQRYHLSAKLLCTTIQFCRIPCWYTDKLLRMKGYEVTPRFDKNKKFAGYTISKNASVFKAFEIGRRNMASQFEASWNSSKLMRSRSVFARKREKV